MRLVLWFLQRPLVWLVLYMWHLRKTRKILNGFVAPRVEHTLAQKHQDLPPGPDLISAMVLLRQKPPRSWSWKTCWHYRFNCCWWNSQLRGFSSCACCEFLRRNPWRHPYQEWRIGWTMEYKRIPGPAQTWLNHERDDPNCSLEPDRRYAGNIGRSCSVNWIGAQKRTIPLCFWSQQSNGS